MSGQVIIFSPFRQRAKCFCHNPKVLVLMNWERAETQAPLIIFILELMKTPPMYQFAIYCAILLFRQY